MDILGIFLTIAIFIGIASGFESCSGAGDKYMVLYGEFQTNIECAQ